MKHGQGQQLNLRVIAAIGNKGELRACGAPASFPSRDILLGPRALGVGQVVPGFPAPRGAPARDPQMKIR